MHPRGHLRGVHKSVSLLRIEAHHASSIRIAWGPREHLPWPGKMISWVITLPLGIPATIRATLDARHRLRRPTSSPHSPGLSTLNPRPGDLRGIISLHLYTGLSQCALQRPGPCLGWVDCMVTVAASSPPECTSSADTRRLLTNGRRDNAPEVWCLGLEITTATTALTQGLVGAVSWAGESALDPTLALLASAGIRGGPAKYGSRKSVEESDVTFPTSREWVRMHETAIVHSSTYRDALRPERRREISAVLLCCFLE